MTKHFELHACSICESIEELTLGSCQFFSKAIQGSADEPAICMNVMIIFRKSLKPLDCRHS